ncbi:MULTISPECIES: hypothetical protein [Actinomycetaceae]|jgi:hypothetical protein|uniref:hypothetical protein n=1 Tax=Actinomycetaceae TaxID=2049 RepID=UPI000397E367|nr:MULTISPECIES: hypothetical protein [Actinomycetaceae]ERH33188.1 hypothetical protein HMPREF1980_00082 [Actinomyces sp. oral taxon 172 str. F0311]WLD78688.1 hypothetical protein QU663_03455 [Schaalia sp. HMT-172]
MNKVRHIYIGIIIFLIAALATTLVLFAQFNNETWRQVATTFIFPFINAIAGAIIVAVVGTIIANKVLENYNKRLSYGLSERVIQLMGDKELSDRVAEDLSKSALIKNRIIQNENVSREADLIVLSLDLPPKIAERTKRQDQAETRLGRVLEQLKRNNDTQGLIVLTPGMLKRPNEHTDRCIARAFSTIVNAQGRVLSDIHSLLTTLPPRNDE